MASSAAGAAAAAARAVAARSVHLKIHPRPRNLSESRELLSVMRRYGEVDMFRHLKYEQSPARNTGLVVFKSPASAEAAIRASPVRFTYGESQGKTTTRDTEPSPASSSEPPPTDLAPEMAQSLTDLPSEPDDEFDEPITLRYPPMTVRPRRSRPDAPSSTTTAPPHSIDTPKSPPLAFEDDSDPRPCTIDVNESRHAHKEYIRRQWYYADFKVEFSSKPGVSVLEPLPKGMMGLGNSDIKKEERMLRQRRGRREEREEGRLGLHEGLRMKG